MLRVIITLSDYLRNDVMDEEEPVPQKFDSLNDLLNELNRAGHPNDQIWFYGANGDYSEPVAFLAVDSRLIAERRDDGSWWTVDGYGDANDPRMPEPEDAWDVESYRGQLDMWFDNGIRENE
ncbi:hypothetical protein DN596_31625 [Klebsiella pneumoniae]|nr:hypothetical protein [Klebsiella michiganensis]ASK03763.1 hypothetical protein CFA70_27810 [Citrobacter freundii]OXJ67745.1 hypothetical protein CDL32_23060 [Escherichia coli]OZQ43086.1 hypothetical protein CIG61_26425 [Klebsiella variicola]PQH18058.1 hypothetical protein C5T93_26900 [Raoultella ornithinolytica]RWS74646.1 hypothetical protein DN596_31625 [Klebsiella pneumoniae]